MSEPRLSGKRLLKAIFGPPKEDRFEQKLNRVLAGAALNELLDNSNDTIMYLFNNASTTYRPVRSVVETLPAGWYECAYEDHQQVLKPVKTNEPKLKLDDKGQKIFDEVKQFWKAADLYKRMKASHKRGYMLHGVPGCGKTNICNVIGNYTVQEYKGIVVTFDVQMLEACTSLIRSIKEKDNTRPTVLLLEDVDRYDGDNSFSEITNFLDGVGDINSTVTISTTNNIKRVSDMLKERPGRFDEVVEIDPPGNEVALEILREMNSDNLLSEEEVIEIINRGKDQSIAALREAFIRCVIFKDKEPQPVKEPMGFKP